MTSDSGFKGSVSEGHDIEWRAASVDTALFALLDRLQRERCAKTTRQHPQFGIVALRHHDESPGSA